ncbi:phosphatidylserine synthase [Escherichia coli]|uniref:Phosphatidylserine synthase n=1 Tax=Escherichia coli TaxID=562 RepID=A0A377AHB0_ECOLX|nr:phosphatidylserine synthase [Escherichia coli]
MAAALIVWMMLIGQKPEIKNDIRLFRQELRDAAYHFQGDADNDQLSVTPLVGLGKSSLLNKTISILCLVPSRN